MKSIVFTSLGIVIIGAAATIGYQQYNKSLNANINSNVSVQPANTNTANSNTVKPIKNNMIGTWIGTSTDSKTKLVITEDEYTEYQDDKETGRAEYKLLDEQTLELKIGKDPVKAKAIVEGDELTMELGGQTKRFKRETGDTTAAGDTPTVTATPSAAPAAPGQVHVVRIVTTQNGASGQFEPAQITVKKGDVIKWVMADDMSVHVVTFSHGQGNPAGFTPPADSPFYTQAGQSYELKVDWDAGTYNYVCLPHAPMGQVGSVTVQ